MRRFRSLFVALSIAVSIMSGGLLLRPELAQAISGGLTISPTAVDTEIAPGKSFTGEILVVNQGQIDYTYKMYATPYSVTGEEYKPYFTPVPGAPEVEKWFALDKKQGALPAGNQDTIPYTITVPQGTPAGSYYATVFAETEDHGAGGVVTRKRVGTVFYLKVSGDTVEKGAIDTWQVPWLQKDPLTATLKMANTGTVHYNAKVNVTISDIFGGQKFVFKRQPQILPQKLRRLDIQWQDGATFGLFKVGGEVEYLGHTEKLPTRYVFVASMPMRLITLTALTLLIAGLIFLGVKRVGRK